MRMEFRTHSFFNVYMRLVEQGINKALFRPVEINLLDISTLCQDITMLCFPHISRKDIE